jgi:hypothetical protein
VLAHGWVHQGILAHSWVQQGIPKKTTKKILKFSSQNNNTMKVNLISIACFHLTSIIFQNKTTNCCEKN